MSRSINIVICFKCCCLLRIDHKWLFLFYAARTVKFSRIKLSMPSWTLSETVKDQFVFIWGYSFFKELNPFPLFNIKYHQIVKLFSHFMNTSKNNHLILIKTCWVSTSWQRNLLRCIMANYFCPCIGVKIKYPRIIQLIIIFIFSSKYIHAISIMHSWMTCSCWRTFWA